MMHSPADQSHVWNPVQITNIPCKQQHHPIQQRKHLQTVKKLASWS